MDAIVWSGVFETMHDEHFRPLQKILDTFLTKANLICGGMQIEGYEYVPTGMFPKLTLLSHAETCTEAKVRVGKICNWYNVHLWSGVDVRLIWSTNEQLPPEIGLPTKRRLVKAIEEYNQTGNVTYYRYNDALFDPALLNSQKSAGVRLQ